MRSTYPARYRDAHGELATTVENDGKTLSMTVDGVALQGTDFDGLEVAHAEPGGNLARLTFASGSLCACTLELEMPLDVVGSASETAARTLEVRLRLGAPRGDGGIDEEVLELGLRAVDGTRLQSSGRSGWFEDELADLQRQLPEAGHLRCCFGCAWSDYSPAGHGLFGDLACFRDRKDAYRAVRSKQDLFGLWDARTELVQETWLCPEFEPRRPGTGYRG